MRKAGKRHRRRHRQPRRQRQRLGRVAAHQGVGEHGDRRVDQHAQHPPGQQRRAEEPVQRAEQVVLAGAVVRVEVAVGQLAVRHPRGGLEHQALVVRVDPPADRGTREKGGESEEQPVSQRRRRPRGEGRAHVAVLIAGAPVPNEPREVLGHAPRDLGQAALVTHVRKERGVLAVGRAGQGRLGGAPRGAIRVLDAEAHQRLGHGAPAQRGRQLADPAGHLVVVRPVVEQRRAGGGERLVVAGCDGLAPARGAARARRSRRRSRPPRAARPTRGRAPASGTRSAPRGDRGAPRPRRRPRAGSPRARRRAPSRG